MKSILRRATRLGITLAALVWLIAGVPRAFAQDASSAPEPAAQSSPVQTVASEIQPAALEALIEQIKSSEETSEDEKTKLTALYTQAIEGVKAAEKWSATAKEYSDRIESAPDELMAVRKELDDLANQEGHDPLPQLPLDALKVELTRRESELIKLRQAPTDLETTSKHRIDRRVEIPKRLAAVKEQLADLEKQLAATSSIDTPAARANRVLQLAQQASLVAETTALEREIQSYEARADLLLLRGELAKKRLDREERFVKRLREETDKLTRLELERKAEEARCEAAGADPAVRELAETIAELSQQNLNLLDEIAKVHAQAQVADKQLNTLRDERARTEERIERSGLNVTFGAYLSKQRNLLPDARELQRNITARVEKIDQVELVQYELEDRLKQFNADVEDRDGYLETLRASVDDSSLWPYLEDEVDRLLPDRSEACTELLSGYDHYIGHLANLDAAERDLLRERDEFAAFIDQRVLWLPNMPAAGTRDVVAAWHALGWLGQPKDWLALAQDLAGDAAEHPLLTFAFLASLVTLVVLRPRLRGYVKRVGEAASRGSFDEFLPTLGVAAASVILALLAPWTLAYLAWRTGAIQLGRLAVAVSSGLWAAALVVLVAEVWRQFSREGGLGEAHFGWAESGMRAIRERVGKWIAPVASLVFIVAAMANLDRDGQAASLGRLAFVIGMLAATVPLHRLLNPRQWLLRDVLAWSHDGWPYRLRYVWFVVFVLAPPTLALLALFGYYHTALKLTVRAFATLCFGAGMIATREIIFRALLIARRRLAMEQARQRRAAARAAAEAAEEGGGETMIAVEEQTLDLSAVSGQTRRLVRAVLVMTALIATYAIWVDVLPALAVLDQVALWTTEAGEVISLKSALFATLIGMLTFVAWKNIPGLLEIAILQRLPLEPSSRFAIATLTSYFIAVIGMVATFSQFGIGWQNVQWLVAAMTVGLGFGLQEIFANFVSGLIILFERPIRVGDVVTAGDVTGAVTKIRIRATTITNWDRKELIIPNKEFVTGRVMNWTLSDQVNRVTINVGVAYGTDPAVVLDILQRIADEHPQIMDDPAPLVSFEELGANSLNFALRAYLPNLDVRLKAITDLNQSIQRRFAEAGVEFSVPQHDVHLRSINAALPFLARLADHNEADAA